MHCVLLSVFLCYNSHLPPKVFVGTNLWQLDWHLTTLVTG